MVELHRRDGFFDRWQLEFGRLGRGLDGCCRILSLGGLDDVHGNHLEKARDCGGWIEIGNG